MAWISDNAWTSLALFQRLGPWEIVLILALVLLLFGGRKLPELARSLARGLKSFKREMNELSDSAGDQDKTHQKIDTKPSNGEDDQVSEASPPSDDSDSPDRKT
jgi:sec-independent protein translocase protein TatA